MTPATIREILPPHTALAYPAMRALRPHVATVADFVALVDERQRPEGYRLVGAFGADGADGADGEVGADGSDGEESAALAVAGFRLVHMLAWGRAVYVDDLSTVPEQRGRGHGGALLDWVAGEATRLGCDQLHLDSGLGPDRHDAHRLYFNHRLAIVSHHFAREL